MIINHNKKLKILFSLGFTDYMSFKLEDTLNLRHRFQSKYENYIINASKPRQSIKHIQNIVYYLLELYYGFLSYLLPVKSNDQMLKSSFLNTIYNSVSVFLNLGKHLKDSQ